MRAVSSVCAGPLPFQKRAEGLDIFVLFEHRGQVTAGDIGYFWWSMPAYAKYISGNIRLLFASINAAVSSLTSSDESMLVQSARLLMNIWSALAVATLITLSTRIVARVLQRFFFKADSTAHGNVGKAIGLLKYLVIMYSFDMYHR